MLEVGWSEILVIAVVLIVVVGPKDLPPMLRAFGKMTTRLRTMAGQFQTQFNEALKEADLDDVRKTMQDAQKLNPLNTLREAITPIQQMGNDLKSELQKSVATPGPNPTVFPAVAETTDPVADILEELPVSPELTTAASPIAAVKPVASETQASVPASAAPAATPTSAVGSSPSATPASDDAGKKPLKASKPKTKNSESATEAVVSSDEPVSKAKRVSKTKAAEPVVVAAEEPAKPKKKKTAKSGTPEGDT